MEELIDLRKGMKQGSSATVISHRVRQILQTNLINPPPNLQRKLIGQIGHLSLDECESLYRSLIENKILKPPFPLTHNNLRRQKRTKHYVKYIKAATDPYIKHLGKKNIFCDLGCGTGAITAGVLDAYIKRGGKVCACDVTNYLDNSLKKSINFTQQDTFLYLKNVKDMSFDGIMSVVMLHHLPSRVKVNQCLKEMARVIKLQGIIVLVETAHTRWYELLKNAVLDKLLNERTNNELKCHIPTPLSLLSDEEIRLKLQRNGLGIVNKIRMKTTTADPKFHMIYICRKEKVL